LWLVDNLKMVKDRYISVDVFRGFTIALMIIVNSPGNWGNTFAPLLHADWHGITLTDFVYPFFIFIVGVSIVLSNKNKGTSSSTKTILFRSIKIFTLGVFLGVFTGFMYQVVGSGESFSLSDIRIPGVLQRIALVYLFCAILYNYTNWVQQLVVMLSLLVVYYILMTFVSVPGIGPGVLEPGKNLAAYIDSLLIPGSMWEGTWDPEGILSTLPAIASGIGGMLAGYILTTKKTIENKVIIMYFVGVFCLLDSFVWEWIMPINKNLWTSTYVMYTTGWAFLMLASSVLLCDILKLDSWFKVGIIFGSNSIAIYALSQMLTYFAYGMPVFDTSFNGIIYGGMVDLGVYPKIASLLWAILYAFVCYTVAVYLYRKKIFFRL